SQQRHARHPRRAARPGAVAGGLSAPWTILAIERLSRYFSIERKVACAPSLEASRSPQSSWPRPCCASGRRSPFRRTRSRASSAPARPPSRGRSPAAAASIPTRPKAATRCSSCASSAASTRWPAGFEGLHYLLYTPFRHPPLRHGSRFGTRGERGILYAARELPTVFAEVAYYRLLFLEGTAALLSPIQVELTVFSFRIAAQRGV